MIDLDAIVLAANHDVWGQDITITYSESRPGDAPVSGVGIFTTRPINVQMEDGTVFSDQETYVDLRVNQWTYLPARGDRIRINDLATDYWVSDSSIDGKGSMRVPLRKVEPEDSV